MIKNKLGFSKLKRVTARKKFALSYYKKPLASLNSWAWLDTEDSNFYYDLTELNLDQLAHVLAVITKTPFTKIRDLFFEITTDDWLIKHITTGLLDAGCGKDIRVGFGRRIGWYALARIQRPRLIVETGVYHGVGSCVLIRALMRNQEEGFSGSYLGTDISPCAGTLISGELKKFGKILYGDSIESLKRIDAPIDLFINDSDHSADYEYREYQTIKHKIAAGALILGDNCHVTNKLSQFSVEEGRSFLFFSENPKDHWYPGGGLGVSYR